LQLIEKRGGSVMKKFVYISLLAVLMMVVGCAPLPPFEIKPQTPNLNIAPSNVKPLNVAIIVQDPMPYTVFYKGQGSYSRDSTAEMRSLGFMLERDLSKIASDTFSQVFRQVVVLRDLPGAGQYDALINLNIGQILMKEKVIVTGETTDISAEWDMSVLDGKNREIFSRKGISPVHNFKWRVTAVRHDTILGINSSMSLILTELAQEWGAMLSNLEIPAAGR
jgi:hypothetical protein